MVVGGVVGAVVDVMMNSTVGVAIPGGLAQAEATKVTTTDKQPSADTCFMRTPFYFPK
jgi:hypothetical protein